MIIKSQAPTRIGLFGGGCDVNPFASEYGGETLSLAINLRQHVTLLTDDDVWKQPEHNLPLSADPALTYKILDAYGLNGMHSGISVKSRFDGIMGAGLGSSGAYGVALVAALQRYKHNSAFNNIALAAYEIEVNALGWNGGRQDQHTAFDGGLIHLKIGDDKVEVFIGNQYIDRLAPYLVLMYAGGTRESHKRQPKALTEERKQVLMLIKALVPQAIKMLNDNRIKDMGLLMHESWQLKKQLSNGVSTPKIDYAYEHAKKNGALGGKLMGAGGCGYMVFFVEPDKREFFIGKMKEKGIENVDFSADLNGVEARIL